MTARINARAQEDANTVINDAIRRLAKYEPLALEHRSRFNANDRLVALKRAISNNKGRAESLGGACSAASGSPLTKWEKEAEETEEALTKVLPIDLLDARVAALERFFESQTESTMRTMGESFLKLCRRWDWKMQLSASWSEKDGNMYSAIGCESVRDKLVKYVPSEHAEWVGEVLEAHAAAVVAWKDLQNVYANDHNLSYKGDSRAAQKYKQLAKDAHCAAVAMQETMKKTMERDGLISADMLLTYGGAGDAEEKREKWREDVWQTLLEKPPLSMFSGDAGFDWEGPTMMMWKDVVFQSESIQFDKIDFLILTSTGELKLVICQTDASELLDKEEQSKVYTLASALRGRLTTTWGEGSITGTAKNRFGKSVSLPQELIGNGWRLGSCIEPTIVDVVWVTPGGGWKLYADESKREVEHELSKACPGISEELYRQCASEIVMCTCEAVGFDSEKGLTWSPPAEWEGSQRERPELSLLLEPETRRKLLDWLKSRQCKPQEWQVFPTWWMVSDDGEQYDMMMWMREENPMWSAERNAEEGEGWVSRQIFVNRRVAEVRAAGGTGVSV